MTIDERLEAITMNLELAHRDIQDLQKLAQQTAEAAKQTAEAAKQNVENIADIEERTAAAEERHDREMADIRTELHRAIQLSVREARQERSKRRAIDDKITQLTAALERLLDTRHGNGGKP